MEKEKRFKTWLGKEIPRKKMEEEISDEYLKGWADGKKETLIVQNRKFEEFIEKLKKEFDVSYKQVWGIHQIKEIIDKLVEEYKTKK